LPKRRFMVDTNLFIAAFKSGYTATTRLLLRLLLDPDVELVVDNILLEEYKNWFHRLSSRLPNIREQAETLYRLLEAKVTVVTPRKEDIEIVKPYMPETELADVYHAAACLRSKAILITNDKDFDNLKNHAIIEIWSITEAIRKLKVA
jgi:predicted nucleic acid-binding protein